MFRLKKYALEQLDFKVITFGLKDLIILSRIYNNNSNLLNKHNKYT